MLTRQYKKVEKNRKRVGASSVAESSLAFILIQYDDIETQYASIVENISEVIEIYANDSGIKVGLLDWSGEEVFRELDKFIEATWQTAKVYATPIINIEKENREVNRIRLAVAAIFVALSVNTVALFIPEQTRYSLSASLLASMANSYNEVGKLFSTDESVSPRRPVTGSQSGKQSAANSHHP